MVNISRYFLQVLLSGCLLFEYGLRANALGAKLLHADARTFGLSARDSGSCADSSYTYCAGHSFPDNFCCPSSTKCLPVNDAKTVICCPAGQTCQFIQPITCNIQQQNATAHPENDIKSVNLTGTLKKCGSDCCPDGYSCQNNICIMDTLVSTPSAGSPTSVVSPTASNAVPSLGSSTLDSPSSSSTIVAADQHCPSFPGRAVAAGFFPGTIAGALATAIAFFLIARRRQQKELARMGDNRRTISKVSPPLNQQRETYRTDFLRRASRTPVVSRARSFFGRSPMIGTPKSRASSNSRELFCRGEDHESIIQRQPSTESINVVFSPPAPLRFNVGRRPTTEMTMQTTFTDMMAQARYNRGTLQQQPPINDAARGGTPTPGGRI